MNRGLALAMGTALAWGCQSVAMSVIVRHAPAFTVAFLKIFSAVVVLGIVELGRGEIQSRLRWQTWALGATAGVALAVSYATFANAFLYVSPADVQLYMQSERFILALCGVFLFKETFNRLHWLGTLLLPVGYYLFFREQLRQSGDASDYYFGVSLVLGTAISWVGYALCQKQLLKSLSSRSSLVLIFAISTLLLFPLADFRSLLTLPPTDLLLLAFICGSSVLAFTCFAEALRCWDISKIGAVISLTPVITYGLMKALRIPGENISPLGIGGAALIVFGSVLASLACSPRVNK